MHARSRRRHYMPTKDIGLRGCPVAIPPRSRIHRLPSYRPFWVIESLCQLTDDHRFDRLEDIVAYHIREDCETAESSIATALVNGRVLSAGGKPQQSCCKCLCMPVDGGVG
jgi:hypothetical protein